MSRVAIDAGSTVDWGNGLGCLDAVRVSTRGTVVV
jgi:hypothetical protein